jgi:hypothetical protein
VTSCVTGPSGTATTTRSRCGSLTAWSSAADTRSRWLDVGPAARRSRSPDSASTGSLARSAEARPRAQVPARRPLWAPALTESRPKDTLERVGPSRHASFPHQGVRHAQPVRRDTARLSEGRLPGARRRDARGRAPPGRSPGPARGRLGVHGLDNVARLGRCRRKAAQPGPGRPAAGPPGARQRPREDGRGVLRSPPLPRADPRAGPCGAGRPPDREGDPAPAPVLLSGPHPARRVGEGRGAPRLSLAVPGRAARPPRRARGTGQGHAPARDPGGDAGGGARPHVERGRERLRPGPHAGPRAHLRHARDRPAREDGARAQVGTPRSLGARRDAGGGLGGSRP